jgi:hypothetical protein
MLISLKTTNIGPMDSMEFEFGDRLNLLTGDNGLGKSFLLDLAWWALTRQWPAELNPILTSGMKALPTNKEKEATIAFTLSGKTRKELAYESKFSRKQQAWTGKSGRPANPGLVIYALSDGSFAVWDPARNYWRSQGNIDVQERQPAYIFSPNEVWNGLGSEDGSVLCNGLIRDWASWQKEGKSRIKSLTAVLKHLSSQDEFLMLGELTRINLDDVRDMPTLKTQYGQDVPIVHASSGVRRIVALAYFLVWAWHEHFDASKLLGDKTTNQVVFLVDEIEAHLHPKWQRTITQALLRVLKGLIKSPSIQVIMATHSPLIMASVEPLFDEKTDAWFDFDYDVPSKNSNRRKVILTKREFEKHGTYADWLMSEAFDLPSDRSLEAEKLVEKASQLLKKTNVSNAEVREMYGKLVKELNPKDSFLFLWRGICEKKGLLIK